MIMLESVCSIYERFMSESVWPIYERFMSGRGCRYRKGTRRERLRSYIRLCD